MHIFCDFDGTISAADTTDLILGRLARPQWRAIEADWETGRIDAATCMRAQIALIDASAAELDAVIETVTLRAGFLAFVRWAARRGVPLTIVSDGIDHVIHAVLARYGLNLPVIANSLVRTGPRRYALDQPYARSGCGSGVCKCAAVSAPGSIVFIGDGRSDFCVADRADLLFATGRLARHCATAGIEFLPFANFTQIRHALDEILHPVAWLAA